MQWSRCHFTCSMDTVIQPFTIDDIAIHRLVNGSCTRIGIVIPFECYWSIIYQMYEMLFEDWDVKHFICRHVIIDRLSLYFVSLNFIAEIPDEMAPLMICIRTIFDFYLYLGGVPRNVIESEWWSVPLSPLGDIPFPRRFSRFTFSRTSSGPANVVPMPFDWPSCTNVNIDIRRTAAMMNWIDSWPVDRTLKRGDLRGRAEESTAGVDAIARRMDGAAPQPEHKWWLRRYTVREWRSEPFERKSDICTFTRKQCNRDNKLNGLRVWVRP